MTTNELLSALAQLVLTKDRVSSLALADALEEVGQEEAAGYLRKGTVGGVRIIEPEKCEWPGCDEHPLGFSYARKARGGNYGEPKEISARVVSCCREHDARVLDYGSPEYIVGCYNCGCDNPTN